MADDLVVADAGGDAGAGGERMVEVVALEGHLDAGTRRDGGEAIEFAAGPRARAR